MKPESKEDIFLDSRRVILDRTFYLLTGLGLLFFLTIFFYCNVALFHFRFFNSDLGIYSQAINNLSIFNLNPYLSVRDIKIFNDHFDPIIFMGTTLNSFFQSHHIAFYLEYFFIFLGLISYFLGVRKVESSAKFFLLLYFLLNRGITTAMLYPSHPGVWAVFPVVLLCLSILKERYYFAIMSFCFLCLFREEFPLVGIPMICLFICKKRKFREVGLLISLTILFIYFDFIYRKSWPGTHINYGGDLLSSIISNPFQASLKTLNIDNIRRILEFAIPPFIFLLGFKIINWEVIVLALPPLSIRFFSGAWENQYSAVPAIFLLMIVTPIGNNTNVQNVEISTKKFSFLLVALFFLVSFNSGEFTLAIQKLNYEFSETGIARVESIKKAFREIENYKDKNISIVAQSNLVPPLVSYNVFEVNKENGMLQPDFFLYEKKFTGVNFVDQARLRDIRKDFEVRYGFQSVVDDEFVYLGKR